MNWQIGWMAGVFLGMILSACEGQSSSGRPALADLKQAMDPSADDQLRGLAPPSLKTIEVPRPADLSWLRDEEAAVALGKAFFWDVQVGSDGQMACATCHFHAGADGRLEGMRHPGSDGAVESGDLRASLTLRDFPLHRRAAPELPDSQVLFDSDDVIGSQGMLKGRFSRVTPGTSIEVGRKLLDPVFRDCQGNARQVTKRNSPTVINSLFNFRNLWDGRASHFFNGVNGSGAGDPDARVWVDDGDGLSREKFLLDHASLASQAVGPALDAMEMSLEGRSMPSLGHKLLSLRPLAQQQVHPQDSVFGTLTHASGRGLRVSYEQLITRAFHPRYWASDKRTPGGYRQMEANFGLFWGLALQLYQSTLVSDDAPFDRYMEGQDDALSAVQKDGLFIFFTDGRCSECHAGPEFTSASVSEAMGTRKVLGRMEMGQGTALYDIGFYNIGVRPSAEDVGIGGKDRFGNPLSYALQFAASGASTEELDVCKSGSEACPLPENVQGPGDGGNSPAGRVAVNGAFKVPGLRNVELTGPYMRNGGMATLDQVLQFYAREGDFSRQNLDDLAPHLKQISLERRDEQEAVVSFLEALTDERVRHRRAPFDHPELPLPDGTRIEAVGEAGGAPLQAFKQRLPPGAEPE